MKTSDYQLVPYEQVEPGFEAAYTGERINVESTAQDRTDDLLVDNEGRVVRKWCTYAAWFSDKPQDWDGDISMLNVLQERLGRLDDEIRRIRAHIGTIEACDVGLPVAVDEVLGAIGHGRFLCHPFRAGCRCGDEPWELRGAQPRQELNCAISSRHPCGTGFWPRCPARWCGQCWRCVDCCFQNRVQHEYLI